MACGGTISRDNSKCLEHAVRSRSTPILRFLFEELGYDRLAALHLAAGPFYLAEVSWTDQYLAAGAFCLDEDSWADQHFLLSHLQRDLGSGKNIGDVPGIWEVFCIAADSGNIPFVEFFLEHGLDVNWVAGSTSPYAGYSLLTIACSESEHEDFIKALLDAGAMVNRDADKYDPTVPSPLLAACSSRMRRAERRGCHTPYVDPSIVRRLLRAGADPNYRQVHEGANRLTTPLLAACLREEDNREVVKMLLHAGAEVNVGAGRLGTEETMTPLLAAICHDWRNGADGRLDIMKLWLNVGADANLGSAGLLQTTSVGMTPLPAAICHKRFHSCHDTVKLLLDAGADVNIGSAELPTSSVGMTPLLAAIRHKRFSFDGHQDLVKQLLDAGADANRPGVVINNNNTRSTTTPLLAACSDEVPVQNPEVIRLLLAAGSDPLVRNERGETALLSKIRSMRALLSKMWSGRHPYTNSYVRRVEGKRAAHCIRLLADACASRGGIDAVDGMGRSAMHVAFQDLQREGGGGGAAVRDAILDILAARGATFATLRASAAENGWDDVLEFCDGFGMRTVQDSRRSWGWGARDEWDI